MANIGSVEPFNPNEPKQWDSYSERIEFFFEANGIRLDTDKRAAFLSICGAPTYELLRSLLAPTAVKDTSFVDIIKTLKNHCNPRTSVVVSRFKFHRREQKPDEGIAKYISELRHLAEGCDFQNTLDDMLRDRLVCGILDESLQRKLLADPQLTFEKAETAALAHEAAAQNVSDLREANSAKRTSTVDKVSFKKGYTRTKQKAQNKPCFRCKGDHSPDECPYKNLVCRFCSKKGHIEKACLAKQRQVKKKDTQQQSAKQNQINESSSPVDNSEYSDVLNICPNSSNDKIWVQVEVNGEPCSFEVDSGAAYSIIGRNCFQRIRKNNSVVLQDFDVILRDYQGKTIGTLGQFKADIVMNKQPVKKLPVIVVDQDRANLLGRNWFEALNIRIAGVHQAVEEKRLPLEQRFSEVFKTELGQFRGPPVSFHLPPETRPIICKVRKVPFALKAPIEAELERLQQQGILEPVAHPNWATPIVPVVKSSNEIRLCGDYRVTVNKYLKPDPYPIPCVQEMLATLAGGKFFAKLDMSQAYQQLSVDDEAANAQTIITHKGAFKVKRLQFGISTAPQIFQKFIETRLAGVPGVLPYFDDILVSASSEEELYNRVAEILKRFQEDGLRLRKDKCVLKTTEVTFLGFKISNRGLSPTEEKIEAIVNAPSPTNVQELQAFLGLINFYAIFLKDKASLAEPLHRLLHKNVVFKWTTKEEKAFKELKQVLTSNTVLAHFHEKRKTIITCDASPYGVGVVLSQVQDDGKEAPVAFHSRTLSSSEKNYAQIDKEALAVIIGVKKFHNYIFGHDVEIRTDHKPLLGLLGEESKFPDTLSPRMLRWKLMLSAYNYKLRYMPGKSIPNADALSRLPQQLADPQIPDIADVFFIESLQEPIWTAEKIAAEVSRNVLLSRIKDWAQNGWPSSLRGLAKEVEPFWYRRNEISVYKNCLLWGSRVIIPPGGRKEILQILHETHPGIVKMKALARSHVWWPGIDKNIEDWVSNCPNCQQQRSLPDRNPIHPWEYARAPWKRLHIDHAGPVNGKYFLIVVDSFSKWLEVRQVPSTSTTSTIKVLRSLFATHGIPEVIVSDNATGFSSQEYKAFARKNGIRLAHVAPYHPSSNGQAERMVRTTKETIAKMNQTDLDATLARFLLVQHTTPHSLTGLSPAEILMGRKLATPLHQIHPDIVRDMDMKIKHDTQGKVRSFPEESEVYARSYLPGDKWLPATVQQRTGPLSYRVSLPNGKILHRHSDQLRANSGTPVKATLEQTNNYTEVPEELTAAGPGEPLEENNQASATESCENQQPPRQRPQRVRRQPQYLSDFITEGGV